MSTFTSLQSKIKKLQFIVIIISAAFLIGCGGSDGAQGPAGPTGAQGPAGPTGPTGGGTTQTSNEVTTNMSAVIAGAEVAADGSTTITFSIDNGTGYPFVGLTTSNIRFTFAQLRPADPVTGESTNWLSYVNRVESAPTDPNLGSGTVDMVQATYERDGTFVDNGDGTYSYTFAVNPTAVTTPLAVTYDADYTHRVAFQISGGDYPTMNKTYDWQPSTGATTGITSREMVVEGTCNACHGELAIHGGGRVDTAYCVTCHNDGTFDANSGENLDMKVMVHRIHMGEKLPSVENGAEYAIWGYRNSKHDYTNVIIPQDVRNCTSCHDAAIAETPDAGNWMDAPTIEGCGSCHDDIDFALGQAGGHDAGAMTDNSECATCHMEGRLVSTRDAHVGVMEQIVATAAKVTADPVAVRVDQASGDIEVDVQIAIDGSPITTAMQVAGVDTDAAALLGQYRNYENGKVAINWDDGTGFQINHQEIGFNDCTPDGAGLFTCVSAGLVAGITPTSVVTATTVDLLVCMNEKDGMIARCDTPASATARVVQVPVDPIAAFFNVDGTTATNGYDKFAADIGSCKDCHADDKYHHGSTELLQCKTCHNATRVAYGARIGDLKHNVHRKHIGFDDAYPNNISACTACHTEDQVELPIAVNTRAAAASYGSYMSATAAVCTACHIDEPVRYVDPAFPGLMDPANGTLSPNSQAVLDHMIQNGAVFGASTFAEANKVESCAVCHAQGAESGIDTVHKF